MQHDIQDNDIEKTEAEKIAQEYQDFAYIVSHDLNTPLRHVKEFTRLLIGARSEGLNSEEKEYVDILNNSLRRLDDMQQGLISFSRINTTATPHEEIDLNVLLDHVLNRLESETLEYNPTIHTPPLPTIKGDLSQIQTLFYNLLHNAIKFHKTGAAREVFIESKNDGDHHVFEIRDNGIGIGENYLTEVFRIFRRLHAGDTFTGNGMGLTLAQKIIHKHRGDIWIESEPDQGTSIFFTIPVCK